MSLIRALLAGKKKDKVLEQSPSARTPSDDDKALAAIRAGQPIVMIMGRAGTGKSTLIRKLIEQDGKDQVVVAPTGVAAVNVGGQTIHSFFRIPPRLHNLSEIQPRRGGAKLFKNLRRVIIDEISMVRADLLDAVDYALQINRKDSRPFGGVQMVLVGDFLQLPPVVRRDEAERAFFRRAFAECGHHRGFGSHVACGIVGQGWPINQKKCGTSAAPAEIGEI